MILVPLTVVGAGSACPMLNLRDAQVGAMLNLRDAQLGAMLNLRAGAILPGP
jgi:hypothetical protein